MWIYPENQQSNQQSKVNVVQSARNPVKPCKRAKPVKHPSKHTKTIQRIPAKVLQNKRQVVLHILCYLSGILLASLFIAGLQGKGVDFIHYYLSFVMDVRRSGDSMLIFSTEFLSSVLLLSIALLCGFCAFGSPLLYVLLLLRGCGAGLLVATLYAEQRMRGILINLLLFLLPEALMSMVLIVFCMMARDSSKHLGEICFKRRVDQQLIPQDLFFCYLICCILSMLPCGLSAILAYLFVSFV